MKQRMALVTITCLLTACDAFDPSYGADTEIPAFDGPVPSSASYVTPAAPALVGNLEVAGHLEGELHGIRLSGETTQNYGSTSEWETGSGYLDVNVAMQGPEGAGMILVGIEGGMRHPLFTEGRWTAAQSSAVPAAFDGTGSFISVSSCAGPIIGDWPFEQSAIDYEVVAEPEREVPGAVVLVIKAAFLAEGSTDATSDISAVIRFTAPE